MKKILLFLLIVLPYLAKSDNFPVGANHAGMAYSTVAVADMWSIYNNQAGLAHLEGISFGAHYNNTFGLKEFGVKSAAFAFNSKPGTFGLAFTNYGFSKFNENKFGLAYALKLAKYLSVGFQMDYFLIQQDSYYGNLSFVAGEIGLLAKPTDKMSIGAHAFNPWMAKMGTLEDERLPTIFRLGMSYEFSEKLLFSLETEKDLDMKPVFKTGIDYNLVSQLHLRTGIKTYESDFYYAFGVGYKLKGFQLDLAVNKHPVLDYQTAISLIFNLGGKNKE